MNEATLYRLYIALELLKEGLAASSAPGPLGPMRALLSLDHSVELTLRALLPEVKEAPQPGDDLKALLRQLFNAKAALQSHRAEIVRVRDVRNGVQHAGTEPSEEDAKRAAREVEKFVRTVVQEVLGKSLEEITLVELVRDSRAKDLLRQAEAEFAEAKYDDACVNIATAFYWATGSILRRLVEPRASSNKIVEGLFHHIERAVVVAAMRAGKPGFNEFAEALGDALRDERFTAGGLFEPLQKLALFSSLGISPRDMRLFLRSTPVVDFASSGKAWVTVTTPSWPPSREAAAFALQFATNAILKTQAWGVDTGEGLDAAHS